jgi:hypothetical protein
MPTSRDQFKSSYGAFTARQRELERSRARRDASEADGDGSPAQRQPATTPKSPSA